MENIEFLKDVVNNYHLYNIGYSFDSRLWVLKYKHRISTGNNFDLDKSLPPLSTCEHHIEMEGTLTRNCFIFKIKKQTVRSKYYPIKISVRNIQEFEQKFKAVVNEL